jgi:hypothetical protein
MVRYIYGLVDPAEPTRVRYVGRTGDPQGRLSVHCTTKGTPTYPWARSVIELGRRPQLLILDREEGRETEGREMRWVQHYRSLGMADLNTIVDKETRAEPRRIIGTPRQRA